MLERFFSKVSIPAPISGCWLWTAAEDGKGYGAFMLRRGALRRAHRVAYELVRGSIPDGLDLDHLCRNRACVNPFHLEPVTRRENILRGDGPKISAALQLAKTHCPHGHEWSVENTYYYQPRGRNTVRQCRACHRIKEQNKKTKVGKHALR